MSKGLGYLAGIDTDMNQPLSRVLSNAFLGATNDGTVNIWVSKEGDDTNGDGTFVSPYKTITAAMAAVTAARKNVIVLPGEYEEADEVTWPTISGVKLIAIAGNYQTIIKVASAAAADQVINVAPGAQTSTFEMWIDNIYIDHGTSGQDGILLNNTSMTKKLNCYLHNVGGDGSASDKMISMIHGDTNNAIRIYWDGDNGGVEGNVYHAGGNNGDRLYITGVALNGGLSTGAVAVAMDIRLVRCTVLHEGITGGDAAQTVTVVGCYSNNNGTFAIVDTSDLAGSHTEAIVANA